MTPRALLLFGLWLAVAPAPAPAQSPRPLSDILVNYPMLRDVEDVKAKAALQAVEQGMDPRGPKYPSAPGVNNNPDVVSEEVVFEGCFIPASANTQLAIFSDDGCDVWIDEVRVLANFRKGQHLPNLAQSFHVLKFKPRTGQMHHIKVRYSNTIFNGRLIDIDGCTLFAYQDGGAAAEVQFVNTARGGDRVVSARDKKLGLPGGVKEITVRVKPDGTEADLLIVRKDKKTSGSASFDKDDDKATKLEKVKGEKKIVIHGRDLSGGPRDVEIQGQIKGKACGAFEFTVFAVDLRAVIDPKLTSQEAISEAAIGNGGKFVTPLRQIYDDGTAQLKKVGYFTLPEDDRIRVFGGIYLPGKILPADMKPEDFSSEANRKDSFFRIRKIGKRQFINGKAREGEIAIADDRFDSPSNLGMDNTAGKDLPNDKHLYVHSIDVVQRTTLFATQKPGDSIRTRFSAVEFFEYAQVQCSNKVEWYLAASGRIGADGRSYEEVRDVKGDNVVALGKIALTPTLQLAQQPAPADLKIAEPAEGKIVLGGDAFVIANFKVKGRGFQSATNKDAVPQVFLVHDVLGLPTKIEVQVISAQGTKLVSDAELTFTARFSMFSPKGKYTLQVYREDGSDAGQVIEGVSLD